MPQLLALANRYDTGTRQGLPGISVYSRTAPSPIEAMIYEPVICLILQGSKTTAIGDQSVTLTPGDALLVSHDLPVTSRITRASPAAPYVALILSLDLAVVRGLYEQLADATLPDGGLPDGPARSLSCGPADPAWLTPLARYLGMSDSPLDASVLGPAILREIHYRLLLSPLGRMLRNLLVADSHASRVARAIHRMRRDFHTPLSVPELARAVGMSPSSFHEHFKSVTGTTPLQYQKDLRLIAARTMLVDRAQSVAQAAFAVGYESPTHFSRDYARKYGRAPSRDNRATLT